MEHGLVILGPTNVIEAAQIYAFDLDHTLIKPRNGRTHAAGPTDWMWWDTEVPKVLRELARNPANGLVIFSNQGGVSAGKTSLEDLTAKLKAVFKDLGFEILTFLATDTNKFRKPSPCMWDHFVENYAPHTNLRESRYIGDAAGRDGWIKDFSADDLKFAHNCHIDKFQTPDEFFLGRDHVVRTYRDNRLGWGIAELPEDLTEINTYDVHFQPIPDNEREIVIFVGMPASGKSYFTQKYYSAQNYTIVNQDTVNKGNAGTRAQCVRAVKAAVNRRENIVIDNTSPSRDSRAEYIKIARSAGYKVKIVHMKIDRMFCEQLSFQRVVAGGRYVPSIAFAVWQKKFEPPKEDEYDTLITIGMIPLDPTKIIGHLIS